MDVKRLLAFLLVVVVSFGVIGFTTPDLVKNLRLGLDLKGGFEILYNAEPIEPGQTITKDVLRQAARNIEHRVNQSGVEEPEITPEGKNRIRVRIAGVTDPETVREILKKPAVLQIRSSDGKVELTGKDFVEGGAKVEYNQANQPYVTIKLRDKQKFYEVTKRAWDKGPPNNTLGIYLDDELVSNPAVNNGPINSTDVMIEGNFTYKEAKNLADTINLGALPVKLTEKYIQSVGATLGQLSLQKTVEAGLLGSVLILLFMLLFYRIPGVIACITLIIYTWALLLVFYLMNATLTLPGIAAFVLGIGMAVDANIITYERIKEEIRSGKTLNSSLVAGSRQSFRTIMDANLTTIFAGIALLLIGTGAIKGFAITLILSIVLSIATNVFLSRFLLNLFVRSNIASKFGYYGVKEAEISEL
ncbi:MAG TPA: protein translocase subunit SecD [Bacilli bacterium]